MTAIDEIKSRIDIVDLVSETVQLRRSGKNYTGFCPFHSNTRTPAFAVFSDSGTWRCFGECNEGGDIFKFVMKKEGWDFAEALRYLAERAGVQLKPPTPEEQVAEEQGAGLRALLEEALVYYRHQLLNTSAGKVALEYLRQQRGLSDAALEAFGVGYAPHSWEATTQHLLSRGHHIQDLLAAGLAVERDEGGYRDRFRHRITFPIRDGRGRMAGFGARVMDPNDIPKFLNSPQTAIFDKGRLLYGLDRARKAIAARDQAVIVEGYLDVIALHQAGFDNSVSPMGTALTEQQLFLLKRYSRRIILALDADAAGDKATLRGLQIARQAMDHEQEPVFDARGLLGFEARLQADLRVSVLPEGIDPDELVLRDPKEWERILESARPIVIHVMESLRQSNEAAGRNLDDPKVKSEIAAQVLPLIEDIPNAIERDAYRQRLARLLRVSESAFSTGSPSGRPRPYARRRPAQEARQPVTGLDALASGATSVYVLEAHCLGVLLRQPDLVYKVDRKLQERQLGRLGPEDFQSADHQAVLRLLHESLDQDMAEPLNFVLNNFSLPMMEMADGLLARTATLDMNEGGSQADRVLEDLMRGILELRRRSLNQRVEYLRYLMEDAQEQGDVKATQYLQMMLPHATMLKRINQAMGEYTARMKPARTKPGRGAG